MTDNISICVTLKNRAKLLDQFLGHLMYQDYDLKKVEICVTDGFSTDNLLEVIQKWYHKFYQIKYAISDRSVLPFGDKVRNPACDYNSQMANQPTFEKLLRVDAEILFTNRNQLNIISTALDNPYGCLYHKAYIVDDPNDFDYVAFMQGDKIYETFRLNGGISCFCVAINKSQFIACGGFDERFAIGFAGEDSHFLRWYRVNIAPVSPSIYPVIHQWHPNPSHDPELQKLRKEYTLPLYYKLRDSNEGSNINNPDWKRPEMLKDERVFKHEL